MFGPVPILNHAAGQQPRRYLLKGMKFMAEYSNSAIVTVAAGQNVPFTEEANTGKPCIVHREGAGLVTLRGLTNQCRAKFKVSFGANIAIPTGGPWRPSRQRSPSMVRR